MNYIFMDNYRGFSETIIPLHNATFLVGENSTGKSSLLSLVYLLYNQQFWFDLDFAQNEFCNLGGYKDIVSVSSPDKSSFSVGIISTKAKEKSGKNVRDCSFYILTFAEEEGIPSLNRYVQYRNDKLVTIEYKGKHVLSCVKDVDCEHCDDSSVQRFFFDIYKNTTSADKFQKVGPNTPSKPPLPFIISLVQSKENPKKKGEIVFIPPLVDFTWLAPIRTKPRRTYDAYKTNFTPQGDHTPYVIRKVLATREKAKKFVELMDTFGSSSGLFTNIKAHSFGRGPSTPFEVIIELSGQPLNISNVGYGISQVLPVIVEMLTRPKDHWFAIQQPEVHLHPRAQAALGDLLHFIIEERGHHYLIETHSDYMIDRFRLRVKQTGKPESAQVIFFDRTDIGNKAHILPINNNGQYPENQPDNFRKFFINEEINLLEI